MSSIGQIQADGAPLVIEGLGSNYSLSQLIDASFLENKKGVFTIEFTHPIVITINTQKLREEIEKCTSYETIKETSSGYILTGVTSIQGTIQEIADFKDRINNDSIQNISYQESENGNQEIDSVIKEIHESFYLSLQGKVCGIALAFSITRGILVQDIIQIGGIVLEQLQQIKSKTHDILPKIFIEGEKMTPEEWKKASEILEKLIQKLDKTNHAIYNSETLFQLRSSKNIEDFLVVLLKDRSALFPDIEKQEIIDNLKHLGIVVYTTIQTNKEKK